MPPKCRKCGKSLLSAEDILTHKCEPTEKEIDHVSKE